MKFRGYRCTFLWLPKEYGGHSDEQPSIGMRPRFLSQRYRLEEFGDIGAQIDDLNQTNDARVWTAEIAFINEPEARIVEAGQFFELLDGPRAIAVGRMN